MSAPILIQKEEIMALLPDFVLVITGIGSTIASGPEELSGFLMNCLDTIDVPQIKKFSSEIEQIAEQFDAFVDVWYYCLNCAAKHGINLSRLEFTKPEDYYAEVQRQIKEGAFTEGEHSQAKSVYTFTTESGAEVAETPTPLSPESAKFIIRMMISEFAELCIACEYSAINTYDMLKEAIIKTASMVEPRDYSDIANKLVAQFGSMVMLWQDSWIFAQKHNVELNNIFKVVHDANMAKKWPDGKFHKREDGKIIKPDGWKEPDIIGAIGK